MGPTPPVGSLPLLITILISSAPNCNIKMSSLSNSFHLPLHIHTSPPSPLQSSWLPGRLICMDYISGISCCRSSAWFLPKEIQAGDLLKVEKQDQYICSPGSLPAVSSLSSCYPKLKVIAPLLEISPPNSPSGFRLLFTT